MKSLYTPNMEQLTAAMVDITQPKYAVQVQANDNRSVLWVNVDGVCVLRVCRIPQGALTWDMV